MKEKVYQFVRSKNFKLAAIMVFIYGVLLYYPLIISNCVKSVEFKRVSQNEWQADVSSLRAGNYYISGGRPKGVCSISLDDQVLQNNQSGIAEIRNHLMMSASFVVPASGPVAKTASLSCLPQRGIPTHFYEEPVLASYYSGLFLQLARETSNLFLGPIFSLVLLISLILTNGFHRKRLKISYDFYLFAVISLIHTLSLAHLLNLFFDGVVVTDLQVLSKILYSASFILLCGNYSFHRKSLLYLHGFFGVMLLYLVVRHPEWVPSFYTWIYLAFPLSSAILAYDLLRARNATDVSNALGVVAALWTLFHIRDFFFFFGETGTYSSPAVIATITVSLTYFRFKEVLKAELTTEQLRSELEVKSVMTQFAAQIAHDIRSPLALLKVLKDSSELPADLRENFHLIGERLSGIVDQLLQKNRESIAALAPGTSLVFKPSNEPVMNIDLLTIIKAVLHEKRGVLGREKTKVQLDLILPETHICVRAQKIELSRVFVNIITNSIEAITGEGKIEISVIQQGNFFALRISDTGAGFPSHLLTSIGTAGVTFNKKGGNGLGLYHAINTLAYWGGSLNINTHRGSGTEMVINIPMGRANNAKPS